MPDPIAGAPSGDEAADSTDSSGQRSLLGRLFNVFSGADAAGDERPAATDASARSAAPAGGLSNLRRLRVDDVAVPRAEIVAVPVTITLPDLVKTFRGSGFSRLPVYDGSLDQPLGIVHVKDLALQQAFCDPPPSFDLRKLVRPLLYAPPSMPLGVLLQKMQQGRIHLALVIDEYGGVDGLLTIEDLIEQVVGEIEDEHDISEDGLWAEEMPGVFLVQARAPLDDFEEAVGLRLALEDEHEEVDTVGGFVSMLAGRVPARGEVIRHDSGVEFEITEADPRRIKRLRVRLPKPGES